MDFFADRQLFTPPAVVTDPGNNLSRLILIIIIFSHGSILTNLNEGLLLVSNQLSNRQTGVEIENHTSEQTSPRGIRRTT